MPELNSAGPSIKREELEMPAERQRSWLTDAELIVQQDDHQRAVAWAAAHRISTLRPSVEPEPEPSTEQTQLVDGSSYWPASGAAAASPRGRAGTDRRSGRASGTARA